MRHRMFTFIFICILFLLVRTASAQVSSPAGGGYYSFEGNEGGFLQASDSDFLDVKLQDEFTIELWIYPKRLPELGEIWFLLQKLGSYALILTKIATDRGASYELAFINDYIVAMNVSNLATNQWTHIAANFWKKEPPFFKALFVNGRSSGTWQGRGIEHRLPLSNFPIHIGRGFDGAIDEIRISKIVRYQDNFAPPNRSFEPDAHTMALWHFDGTGQSIFEDSSGNENQLTVGLRAQLAWQTKAPMPTSRTEMSAIALGKKIYVFGGFDSKDRFTTTEIYDSETDSWRLGAPVPEHVNHAGIGVVNSKIYIIGGGKAGSKSCWEYDPTLDKWSRKADMIHQRWAPWVAELDSKLYAIGGLSDNSRTDVAPIEVYDPITNTWQEKAPLPNPRNHLVAAAVNGKIYAIGGRGLEVKESNLVHEYDPKLDVWKQKASMPTSRSGMMVAVANNKIHVIGGEGPLTGAHEIYNPAIDKWEIAPPLLTMRSGLAGGVIDNKLYTIGGHGIGVYNVNEVFTLPVSTTVAVESKQKYLTTFGSVKQNTLGQNFPNPFNPETWIPYQLADSADVSLRIYDVSGRIMRTLSLGRQEAGWYLTKDKAAYWDGRNEAGEYLSNGVYFYELVAGSFRSVRKMAILK